MANAAKVQVSGSQAVNAATAHVDKFARQHLPPPDLWPEFIFTRPELCYPARLNCVSYFLDRWVEQGHGDAPCVISPAVSYTYRELQALVNRIANVLVSKLGLVTGGRVLLRSANSPMMVAAYLAVIKSGGICVATMPLLRAKELSYPIQKAEITLALCDGKLADEMEKARVAAPGLKHVVYWGNGAAESLEALIANASSEFTAVDTASDDICLIAFTSGTTGDPKGTMHFHRDMLAVCDGYARNILRAEQTDRFIGSAPLAFTFGFGGVLFPLHIGASFVVLEKTTPDDFLTAIEQYKATICFTAPTAYRAMIGKLPGRDISSLRKCVSAGETLPKPTFDAWLKATGIKLMDGIGSTELLHIFISAIEDEIRPGATGKPVPGYEAKIVDDDGNDLPAGTIGKLAVRGPTGCRYLADERQRKYVQNGWNITGDTYLMDADGYFWYQSRSDDMIVSSGYNIAGTDVEAALLTHPSVVECGVVGAPDEARGMIVKAYVIAAPGVTPNAELATELQEHVKREIAPYKYPRAIEFVTQLPKTETGKLKRFALRQLAQAAATSSGVAAE
ncbi:benzoate-CoA ligase family protein [Bradyrhizobium sp. WYCCWR 13023]|uniref:Benzoate-CoA ligase family protein n=1 Tax=Bradyrhizobium zhengyangense TaxID=2911009 RepID=A0A9X1R6R8_9BRAD|nr:MULTISPECIES: benzoate-CoA ligase family protein [Bradyrhizobium]MCG2625977.1 benzoate-CoA ligase family protein [Bradyrhizobium zhengyangense]MCG2671426.1 benzoate-CoA ligase family protein [Bradyrhizobium zhengyangense]MDA9524705.1 2-aminobenzoate-CoA ligase [Bradyrhizobium sp. CCBAU 11434]